MTNGCVNAANSDQDDNNPGELFHFPARVQTVEQHTALLLRKRSDASIRYGSSFDCDNLQYERLRFILAIDHQSPSVRDNYNDRLRVYYIAIRKNKNKK